MEGMPAALMRISAGSGCLAASIWEMSTSTALRRAGLHSPSGAAPEEAVQCEGSHGGDERIVRAHRPLREGSFRGRSKLCRLMARLVRRSQNCSATNHREAHQCVLCMFSNGLLKDRHRLSEDPPPTMMQAARSVRHCFRLTLR